jgi:predicted DsbA family dithiol-disulfide isomerase
MVYQTSPSTGSGRTVKNDEARNTMKNIQIDFVSDVACPWCAVGLGALEQAIANIAKTDPEVRVSIRFQPFQLNPNMPPEGQDIIEHLSQKYGSSAAQQAQTYEAIRQRGAEVGFDFRLGGRGRTWNTFDCHRLLEWAHETTHDSAPEKQQQLKKALLKAYFTDGLNPAAHDVLLRICGELGLDVTKAEQILANDAYTQQVRTRQAFYATNNINSVPAVIINEQYLISGGQPVATFEGALRQVIQEQSSVQKDLA